MNAFDQLITLPDLRRLFDLTWRTFGVNPALVSMDGQQVVIFDHEARAQPFCRALNALPGGKELCAMCDRSIYLEARRDGQALRYRCHAGLREFVIPESAKRRELEALHERYLATAEAPRLAR